MSQWHCCEHGTFDPREGCAECKSGADELHRLNTDVATLTSELAEARAERDSLAETRAALTANLNALTVDVATMRAERDEARRMLAEMWSAAWLLMWRAIGDSISADDWCNEWARCPSPEAFAEVTRERDAYRDGRYAGPWQPVADHHNGEGYSRAGAAFVGLRRDGRYEWNCAGFKSALVETAAEAKAAADAHLIAAGWFLAGGPHGAGEAK